MKIERLTQAEYPGWVVCGFTDAAGIHHVFEEKVPVVSDGDLDSQSEYPRSGVIGCQIIGTRLTPDGRELIVVDTEQPWGIESKAGETRFEVFREQLVEFNRQ